MKFGDSLWARSVQGWRSYNVDYASIKQLIKEHTTPGKGKGVAVPGSNDIVRDEFEEHLFLVIQAEHDRVSLFVKSKWFEVRSRLGSIERQINLILRKRGSDIYPKDSLKLRRKYSRIESEILSVGEEIKNLSRFIGINCLAIRKLLKKHAKWTGSTTLSPRVQKELLSKSESLSQYRLEPVLNQYTAFLDVIRSPFERTSFSGERAKRKARSASASGNNDPLKLIPLLEGSAVEFDAALEMSWTSPNANTATYWVHNDSVVELRVMLLQHMRHAKTSVCFGEYDLDRSKNDRGNIEKEDFVEKVIIDNLERFAESQNEPLLSKRPESLKENHTAAVTAMWASRVEGAVLMKHPAETESGQPLTLARITKEQIPSVFGMVFPSLSQAQLDSSDGEGSDTGSRQMSGEASMVRDFLAKSRDLKPLVRLRCRRTRFVGLENTSTLGVWAVLDKDIEMSSLLTENASTNGAKENFPHAVLTVRGATAGARLIQLLDETHLTERVRGFSVGMHAIAKCCRPRSMPTPYWFAIMDKDIRHIPEDSQPGSARSSSISTALSSSRTKNTTPTSQSRSSGTETAPSSGNVAPGDVKAQKPVPEPDSGSGRRTSRFTAPEEALTPVQKYWNEYDNPESVAGDDGGIIIYVDPEEPVFPGQKTAEAIFQKIKSLLSPSSSGKAKDIEAQALDDESSSDEESDEPQEERRGLLSRLRRPNYGSTAADMASRTRNATRLGTATNATGSQRPYMSLLALTASVIILAIVVIMHYSSRRKLRGRVDIAVLVGMVASVFFAGVAAVSSATSGWGRQEAIGLAGHPADKLRTFVSVGVFVVVCLVCGYLASDGLWVPA